MPSHPTSAQRTPATMTARPIDRKQTDWLSILLLAGTALYLYLNLFDLRRTPFLLSGDQVYCWMDAQRLLGGEHIYQDFFRYTPPGADLLYAAVFKLFGPRIWVTNATVLALGVAFCWQCFSLSSKIMQRRAAVLATALFLVLVYGKALNGTSHWFAVLAILAALNISMEKLTARRIAAAGALLGLASFFNQAHGAAALLAFTIFLLWRPSDEKRTAVDLLKDLAPLYLAYAVVLLFLSGPFIVAIGLKQLWYFQITYVMKYRATLSGGSVLGLPKARTWRAMLELIPHLFVYCLLPVIYCLSLWRCWRQRKTPSLPSETWEGITLLSLVGLFLLLEVAASLNWLRLYAVSIPGIILLVWTIDRIPNFRRHASILLWIGITCLAARQIISSHAAYTQRADLPGGLTATTPQSYEKLHWIAQRTHPGEFFLQAGWPGMYLPLQLRNPLYVATVAHLDATSPQDIDLAIQQLQSKDVQFILWAPSLDSQCGPGARCNDYLTPLRDYIHSSYTRIRVFPDGDTLWRKH